MFSFFTHTDQFVNIFELQPYGTSDERLTFTAANSTIRIESHIPYRGRALTFISPGLNGQEGTVSITPSTFPGRYLTVTDDVIELRAHHHSDVTFHDRATFWPHQDAISAGSMSFESVAFPRKFIAVSVKGLILEMQSSSLPPLERTNFKSTEFHISTHMIFLTVYLSLLSNFTCIRNPEDFTRNIIFTLRVSHMVDIRYTNTFMSLY